MAKRTARGQRAAKARTAAVKEKNRATTPAAKAKAQRKIASAGNVMKAEASAAKLARTGSLADLREAREEQMDIRAKRFIGADTTSQLPSVGYKYSQSLEDTIAAANQARAYADAMRRITGREKGVGTPYTGGGIELDEGGQIQEGILDQFRDERFMGDMTSAQMANIQDMLAYGDEESVRDRRATWREEIWDDTWNPDTGRWEKGDRTAALERQQEYLKNPPTYEQLLSGKYPLNLGNQLNRNQGTSAFQHPYAADPYTVPHMQTGAGWEGLGAEYQPGTVEGLGLLAGDAYAPYEPLGKSLLDARPSFMGTPKGFTPMNFKGGLEGSTDSDTNNNTKDGLWSPSYQMRNLSRTGGFDWSWGYYDQGGDWVNTTKASE